LPLFVPPLVAGIAWTILGSPRTGLINTVLAGMGIDWRVNFYSMPGLIAVFGMYYAPYVYMFTASALRNMDPSLEEAAQIYCRVTGSAVPELNWYFSYNLFRLACITQGIAGRIRDGTAASAKAMESAKRTVPLAKDSWKFAQNAGAV